MKTKQDGSARQVFVAKSELIITNQTQVIGFKLEGAMAMQEKAHSGVMLQGSWPERFMFTLRKYWFIYLLALPGFVFMLIFCYGPMYGIQMAFKDYKMNLGVWGSPWVGLQHFRTMFADPVFLQAFKNTVIINLYNLIFGFSFNVFLALIINELRLRRLKSLVQTFVYLPYFLSWVIFAGLVQVFLAAPLPGDMGGAVNQLLAVFGMNPVDFMKRPELFRGILVITNIIKTAGYSTIIYLAAIAGVNPALYESAQIDGANRWKMMLHITIPRIMPSVSVMFILAIAQLFQSNFDQTYNLYNNFVLSTGDVLSTYSYRISLGGGVEFEKATAASFLFNAMGLIAVTAANRFVKKMDVMGIF
jgi:putative aldouronate transport system permease protein